MCERLAWLRRTSLSLDRGAVDAAVCAAAATGAVGSSAGASGRGGDGSVAVACAFCCELCCSGSDKVATLGAAKVVAVEVFVCPRARVSACAYTGKCVCGVCVCG